MEAIRINKYLSSTGYCSRRKADQLISEGKILVNGRPAENGMLVSDEDEIIIDGIIYRGTLEDIKEKWFAFYKPRGIVCSEDGQGSQTVWDYLGITEHLFTVGRLDKESEGLLLITNQGDKADEMLRARNGHRKEYIVTIDRPVTDSFVKKMSGGVNILDTVTRECEVCRVSKYTFRIVLTQGLNRQIRRMCEACGAKVVTLKRISFCDIQLGDLKPGEIKEIILKK